MQREDGDDAAEEGCSDTVKGLQDSLCYLWRQAKDAQFNDTAALLRAAIIVLACEANNSFDDDGISGEAVH